MSALGDLVRKSDPFGVGIFVFAVLAFVGFSLLIGSLVVQDGNLQRECVQKGYSYVDGDCIADYRSK